MNYWWLPLIVLGIIIVHSAKMMRLYFVLMEQKIGFGRFLLLYGKTTVVNLIIPFKIGELFRIYSISKETKVWQVGILSVLADRFFDLAALLFVLLPFDIIIGKNFTTITGVFLIGTLVVLALYQIFKPTYEYLNQYIICHKSSRRSMWVLKALNVMHEWYRFLEKLIKGRFALILIASIIGWLVEVVVLKVLALYLTVSFDIQDFSAYVQTVLFAGQSTLARTYVMMSALVLAIFTIILYICFFAKSVKRKGNA